MLLDTHALVWWWRRDARLPHRAFRVISDAENDVIVSAAAIWEIAIKHHSGKWAESGSILDGLEQRIARSGFKELPISIAHARLAGALEGHHKDPFDRVLIAQARCEGISVVTADAVFGRYGLPLVWR